MTPSSKQKAPKVPLRLTPDEKVAAVELFRNRGDRKVQDIAEELGTSIQMLYHWNKILKTRGTFERSKPGPKKKPKNKAVVERERTEIKARKPPSTAMVLAKQDARQMTIDLGGAPAPMLSGKSYPLAMTERDYVLENAMLRAEVDKLRRVLSAVNTAIVT